MYLLFDLNQVFQTQAYKKQAKILLIVMWNNYLKILNQIIHDQTRNQGVIVKQNDA